jgi:hypothetical protein
MKYEKIVNSSIGNLYQATNLKNNEFLASYSISSSSLHYIIIDPNNYTLKSSTNLDLGKG